MTSESPNVSEPPLSATPLAGSGIDHASILSKRSASTQMGGIIADVQRLIEQQLAMVRQEIRDDLRKSKHAVSSLALGAGLTLDGNCLLFLILPLLLNTGTVPLKLYTLYARPNHRDGVVHHTRTEAEADSEHYDGKTTESTDANLPN